MEQLAGILLMVIASALFVNFVQGGPGQARRWLAAKFLGQPGGAR
jgi:hypothetical protein